MEQNLKEKVFPGYQSVVQAPEPELVLNPAPEPAPVSEFAPTLAPEPEPEPEP